jgi:hypothetical protein
MNKKADLPIIILVIGVVFVCGLAMFSFYTSLNAFKENFISVSLLQEMNFLERRIEFYQEVQNPAPLKELADNGVKKIIKTAGFRSAFVLFEESYFYFKLDKEATTCKLTGKYVVVERNFPYFEKTEVEKISITHDVACGVLS